MGPLVLIGVEVRPCFGGLTFKNRGQLGSRYVYVYIPGNSAIVPFLGWLSDP